MSVPVGHYCGSGKLYKFTFLNLEEDLLMISGKEIARREKKYIAWEPLG